MFGGFLGSRTAIFLLGMASAAVMKAVAPALGGVARQALRNTIKGGLVLKQQLQTVVEEAWQDVEDLTAEAQAELDRERQGHGQAS
jgi:hypothetical protein